MQEREEEDQGVSTLEPRYGEGCKLSLLPHSLHWLLQQIFQKGRAEFCYDENSLQSPLAEHG